LKDSGGDDKGGSAQKIATPIGRFSYPFFLEKKTGGQYPSDKYECDLLVTPEEFNSKQGEVLQQAIIMAAQELFSDATIESWEEFQSPFKEVEGPDGNTYIRIRAKSQYKPTVYNAQKKEMDDEDVKDIKGGDYGRLVVQHWTYTKKDGGVSLNLEAAQFWKEGEAFGQGSTAALDILDEMEVELEDVVSDDSGDGEHDFA
jgi:hypothetical protein